MRSVSILVCYLLVCFTTGCSKKNVPSPLPDGSVGFQHLTQSDTLVMPLSVLSDSAVVVGLIAELSGKAVSADHWVRFATDTTKIAAYRAKYGDALLLPASSWFLYREMAKIAAGSLLSDSGQINIAKQTQLRGYSTYVLPIVIQSVDGQTEGAPSSQVLYLVFKTGKPAFIPRDAWTIAGVSSSYSSFVPQNVLDKDDQGTYWVSSLTQTMPQWVAINFNSTVTFSAVNYYIPPSLHYPANGGYPTSVQVETSMDGTNWVSRGVFAGDINNNMQTLNTGLTTAQYLRFTVLSVVPYGTRYNAVFISGIKLVP